MLLWLLVVGPIVLNHPSILNSGSNGSQSVATEEHDHQYYSEEEHHDEVQNLVLSKIDHRCVINIGRTPPLERIPNSPNYIEGNSQDKSYYQKDYCPFDKGRQVEEDAT